MLLDDPAWHKRALLILHDHSQWLYGKEFAERFDLSVGLCMA